MLAGRHSLVLSSGVHEHAKFMHRQAKHVGAFLEVLLVFLMQLRHKHRLITQLFRLVAAWFAKAKSFVQIVSVLGLLRVGLVLL